MKLVQFLSLCGLTYSSEFLRSAPVVEPQAPAVEPLAQGDPISEFPIVHDVRCIVRERPYQTDCLLDNTNTTMEQPCGLDIADPCAMAMPGDVALSGNWTDLHCNHCYRIDIDTSEDQWENNTDCVDGTCPTYQKSIYVKVNDVHSDASMPDYVLHQNGWMALCPFVCEGSTNFCVEDEAACVAANQNVTITPPYGDDVVSPGSCTFNTGVEASKLMRIVEVECAGAFSASVAFLLAIGALMVNV